MRAFFFFASVTLVLFFVLPCGAQDSSRANAPARYGVSLNGEWNYIVDPYENGYYNYRQMPFDKFQDPPSSAYFTNTKPSSKSDLLEYDFDKSPTITVPGDWNSQDPKLYYYEGTVWYKKSFDYKKKSPENRVFLRFGAVNYKAEVYVNGTKVGSHVGGFTPFEFEVDGILKDQGNFVVVKVDNKRVPEGVPTVNTDWWNYGGITRDVTLVETPPVFIRDHFISIDKNDPGRIVGRVALSRADPDTKVQLRIPDTGTQAVSRTNEEGVAEFSFPADEIDLWSPENPKLYTVEIQAGDDRIEDRIGFRTIETDGARILLNGHEVFLRGISIHEENPIRGGRANSREDALQLLGWAKELGCNYVRLAHYPHNEYMLRVADELGLMVWAEIPVYWTIRWENEDTFRNAENQLSEMIVRDRNRASVIIWSMANETPVSEPRNRFLKRLADKARSLDRTRLISAALEQSSEDAPNVRTISDPFLEEVDLISFNQYIGWYDGLPDKTASISWKLPTDKPVLISEFGAGAKFGFHGDAETRWTEEYQEDLYAKTLKMLEKIPNLSGMSPWILADFRSPRRHLPRIQDEWNRKGLLSDKGEKKKAWFVLQEFYNSKTKK